jgi:hypothetical protein
MKQFFSETSRTTMNVVHSWTGYWIRGSYRCIMTVELVVAANQRIYGGGSDDEGEFTCTGEPQTNSPYFPTQSCTYLDVHHYFVSKSGQGVQPNQNNASDQAKVDMF